MLSPISRIPSRIGLRGLVACMLSCVASGCVLGSDSDPPILSVDFYWQRTPNRDDYRNDCRSLNLATIDWKLLDNHGHTVTSQTGIGCEDGVQGVDFDISLAPTDYRLLVTGYDDNDQALWNADCPGLTSDRFDRRYECDIDQSAAATGGNSDEDAGTPADAGS
jgi:hypothetical protein